MLPRALYVLLLVSVLSAGCGANSEPYSMPDDPGPPPTEPLQGTDAPTPAD